MDTEPTSNNKKLAATIGLIVIVAAIAVGVAMFSPKQAEDAAATPALTSTTLNANTASPSSTAAASYKDGTYSATGDYNSPGGPESVTLDVTLKDGKVANSVVTTSSKNPKGKEYQTQFIDGYKSFVTGKNIDEINLSKVSGSSLTPEGFNNALTKIKSQAKA